jgi:hypothetical protein
MNCTFCSGGGYDTCPGCYGRKIISRFDGRGGVETTTCLVCLGKGKVPCEECKGTGNEAGLPLPPPSDPANPLIGRWLANDGEWYEFLPDDSGYAVKTGKGSLQTGTGRATLNEDLVRIEVKVAIWGTHRIEMKLSGTKLIARFKLIGLLAVDKTYQRQTP